MLSRLFGIFTHTQITDEEADTLLNQNEVNDAELAEDIPRSHNLTHMEKVDQLLNHIQEEQVQIPQHRISLKRKILIYTSLFSVFTLSLITMPSTCLGIIIKIQLNRFDAMIADLNAQLADVSAHAATYQAISETEDNIYHDYYRVLNRETVDHMNAWVDTGCTRSYDLSEYYGFHKYGPPHTFWIDTQDLITGMICAENVLAKVDKQQCRLILQTACDILQNNNATLSQALEHFHSFRLADDKAQTYNDLAANIQLEISGLPKFSGAAIASLVLIPVAMVSGLALAALILSCGPLKSYRKSLQALGTLAALFRHSAVREPLVDTLNAIGIPFNPQMKIEAFAVLLQDEKLNAIQRHNMRIAFFSGSVDHQANNHAFLRKAPKDVKNIILDMSGLSRFRGRISN